ncbi:uncharacterized protein LOC117805870 [Notolabrus celidotus]|uniref:uncharacterized protein LOC117805870 n=1 Tax=Notolabrus celidotus TaxID=1203425 RepID=UPI00148F4E2A|nr:uncharacterized protein LOC117805870 [Notolabrus celidotus]
MAMSSLSTGRIITVSDFLRDRNVPEEAISYLEEEKIDKDVIPLMEDGHLAKFVPSFGDRLALVNFCRNQTPLQKRKMGLFEKLRSKLQMKKKTASSPTSTTTGQGPNTESQIPAKKRGKASHRKIEIGWLHSEGGVVKQIRAKQGGGTRTVVIGVDCGMDTVLEKGKNFFFPKGTSTKGNESDFKFEVWDYKHHPVHEDVTVGFVYDTLGMARLRFYVATCSNEELQKDSITDKPDDDVEEIMVKNNVSDKRKLDAYANVEVSDDDDRHHHEGPDDFEEDVIFLQDDDSLSTGMEGSSQHTQLISVTDSHGITGAHLVAGGLHTLAAKAPHVFQSTDFTSDDTDFEVAFGSGHEHDTDLNDTEPYDFEILHQHPPPTTSPFSVDESQQQPPTVLCAPSEEGPQQLQPKVVTIHHGSCLDDMISGFLDPAVLTQPLIFKRLLPDNTEENGTGSGVVKDVYSSFWNEFYDRCTVGTTVKVPFIRHDFHSDTWKAVGRILLKGYQTCQYLPIKLALPFVEEILYGAVCSDLLETFKYFVSLQDHNILSKALTDFCSVDTDELMDVLENYECRKRVTAETLRDILMEIAHKELVQKPMYVIDCWKDVIQPNITLDHIELVKMYNSLRPTPKKVQGLLHFPVMMTAKQREVENHLKRYIRELDDEKLCKFLRFTTGSDVITCNRIEILFTNMSTFTRRPIGHTCGRVLELAECYENFPDFRSEFNAVFDSNIWIMDIV